MPSTSRRPADQLIATAASRQHGLVTVAQLRTLGLTDSTIAYRAKVGRLHRVHRGVYAVGHLALSPSGRCLAAVLAIANGAVLSHLPAAELWGLLGPGRSDQPIDVTVARGLRPRAGLRIHSVRALDPRDTTTLDAVPITTPERTLLDLAAISTSEHILRRAVGEAQVQGHATARSLLAAVQRSGRRGGAARLKAILRPGPAPTRSELEDRTLAFLLAHGLPRPQINAGLPELGGRVEVDFLYPAERLVIEADGARYHDHPLARERDARRQARIEAEGYRVMRLTWHQLTHEGPETIMRLRAAFASARARPPPNRAR